MFFSGGLIPTYLVVSKLGLVNTFPVMLLAPPMAISVYLIIVMRTFFLQTIPEELFEAARMDGSSDVGTLLRVVLPLSGPVLAVMVLFYGVSHWNSYFNALIYLTDRSRYTLQLFLREILIQSRMDSMLEETEEYIRQAILAEGIKYAVIIVASVPVLLLYPFLQRYFVKGVMIGAIKG
jgi:putative aldouronate transport system permease protein